MIRKELVLASVVAVLSGCLVGPRYERPEIIAESNQDAEYHSRPGDTVTRGEVMQQWWITLGEPELITLVNEALAVNNSVQVARANLQVARAGLRETARARLPVGDASAGVTRQRQGQLFPGFTVEPNELYRLSIDAAWELDFFGRVRQATTASEMDVESAEAAVADAQVTVTAEVGLAFTQMRGAQRRLEVARRNAANQQATLELTQTLRDGGRGTDLDVARAEAQLRATQALMPNLFANVQSQRYRLGVLTRRTPSQIAELVAPNGRLPGIPLNVGVGAPSDLLRRRPDVRRAERQLAAATLRISVATADLYPRFDLLASIGRQAFSASGLTDAQARSYSFGPAVSWPLLDLKRTRARIDAADGRAHAALNQLEQTWLAALAETETAIVTFQSELARLEALKDAASANVRAADLARKRYRAGVDNFLQVLDAERRVLESEDQLAGSETAAVVALIALYKSLGGGWEI
ncbi:MAG: efflux transporter outer membrane subunit [Lysobacterales bacterium]